MILLNITHICNTICSLQCFQRIYWFIWLTEKRVHADFLCLCQLKKKKKKSNVTHVKEKSNIRFRSCSVNAAREELLSLKPGSSHPTTQTLQRSGTGKPRLIYLASKRRVEDTADRERERARSSALRSDSDSSSGLQVSTQVGLHQACIIRPTCVTTVHF